MEAKLLELSWKMKERKKGEERERETGEEGKCSVSSMAGASWEGSVGMTVGQKHAVEQCRRRRESEQEQQQEQSQGGVPAQPS